MSKHFTSLQLFLAAALSLVLFIGVFWVERASYQQLSSLQDPFAQTELVDERLVMNNSNSKTWLHPSGELFAAFAGTKVNFTNQARELEEGSLYVDTNFISQTDTDAARDGLTAPFTVAQTKPLVGQLRAGPVIISIPQGIAILRRDLIRQEVEVYAHDHPVEIFIPQGRNPFLLPPGYTVLIKESRVDTFGRLYYTKLKKELYLKPYKASTSGLEHFAEPLEVGLAESEQWRERIIAYAEQVVLTWERFSPSSVMGGFLSVLSHVQRYYALGVDKPYKADYQYGKLRTDLINAYFAINNARKVKALESGKVFLEKKGSPTWARFFVEHPEFTRPWDSFTRTQRVWMYYLFPDSFEVDLLEQLWGPSKTLDTLQDYADNYYLFEKYHASSFRSQAQDQLVFLTEEFENLPSLEESDQPQLSDLRRQLSLLLQSKPVFRNNNSFKLYGYLVTAEQITLNRSSELAQEIRLEIAQELLLFLRDVISSESRQDQDLAIILLRTFRDLEISKLADSLGRAVFSGQEMQTLTEIKGFGSLDEDKLAAIRESNRAAADALKLFDSINAQEPIDTDPEPTVFGVQKVEDLEATFTAARVLTQGMSIELKEKESGNIITFSGASYEGYSLQGTFLTKGQKFGSLQLGSATETRASLSNFRSFLSQMVRKNESTQDPDSGPTVSSGPNNYNSTAILQRRNVLKLLDAQGITVKLDNVLMTDEALTVAEVKQASLDKQYLLTLTFDLNDRTVSEVTVEYGRSQILLPGEVFDYSTLASGLRKAIESKLVEVDTEE